MDTGAVPKSATPSDRVSGNSAPHSYCYDFGQITFIVSCSKGTGCELGDYEASGMRYALYSLPDAAKHMVKLVR